MTRRIARRMTIANGGWNVSGKQLRAISPRKGYPWFMGAEALRIFEQALTLSETERAELAAKLLASLDEGSDPDTEEAWAAEVTKRAESVVRGEAKLIAWEDIDGEAAQILTR